VKLFAVYKLQFGVGVDVGVFVCVGVRVGVGVKVGVGVSVAVGVSVGGRVLVAVGGMEVIDQPSGVLMARTARNVSTIPWRYDARWIMEGSIPKISMTMKVKL
jgi:hypothetical protein